MRRHIRVKHPAVYEKEEAKKNTVTITDKKLQFLGLDDFTADDDILPKEDGVVVEEVEIATEDKTASDKLLSLLEEKNNELKKGVSNKRSYRKRSWVRNYCEKVGPNLHRCLECGQTLALPPGVFNNMKRHFKKKHHAIHEMEDAKQNRPNLELGENAKDTVKDVLNDEECESQTESDQLEPDSKMNSGALEWKIKRLCNRPLTYKKKGRTCIWNFVYNVLDNKVFRCKFCQRDIVSNNDSVANIRRHIMNLHTNEYKMILKYAPRHDYVHGLRSLRTTTELSPEAEKEIKDLCNQPVSGKHSRKTCIWNFFQLISPNVYTCRFCDRPITRHSSSVGNFTRHIRRLHRKEFKTILKYAHRRDSIREPVNVLKNLLTEAADTESFGPGYFQDLGDGLYKCKECDETVECENEDQGALFSHIQEKHPEQVVMYQEGSENEEEFSVIILK